MPDNSLPNPKATDGVGEQQDRTDKVRLTAWMPRTTYDEIVGGFRSAGLRMTAAEAARLVLLGFARLEGMRTQFADGLALVVLDPADLPAEEDRE